MIVGTKNSLLTPVKETWETWEIGEKTPCGRKQEINNNESINAVVYKHVVESAYSYLMLRQRGFVAFMKLQNKT